MLLATRPPDADLPRPDAAARSTPSLAETAHVINKALADILTLERRRTEHQFVIVDAALAFAPLGPSPDRA